MKLSALSVIELMRALQSSEPTPGGGSASALAGAAGAALLAMVAGLPKPRAATQEDLQLLRAAAATCADLSQRLTALIDQDSEAYDRVVAAFRLPKATDEDKSRRAAGIQAALQAATEAPLEVMRGCAAALAQGAVVAALGNRNASSDVQVGVELLGAGLRGARLNVDINLPSLTEPAFVQRVTEESAALARSAEQAIGACRGAAVTQ